MGTIGLPEILVILFIVALLASPFVLRRRVPGKVWLGILLAFCLGPWGHWYLPHGKFHVVALWALAVLLGISGQPGWLTWAGVGFVSVMLMFYRFRSSNRTGPAINENRA